MPRRGENIFKRKDGRWEARIAIHFENGRRAYRSLYGKTYAEAKARKEEYYSIQSKLLSPGAKKLTAFSVLAEQWLNSIRGTVKESSYTKYHQHVHSYLLPTFGSLSISKIDLNLVNQFKDKMMTRCGKLGNGLSEKTVIDALSILRMILTHAAGEGYPAMNTALIRNPRRRKGEKHVIPQDALNRLEDILLHSNENISLGILLALHTGIRNGELCGLQWNDFNFSNGTVCIRRTVERIANLDPFHPQKTKIIISEPKTETSKREIPLSSTLCRYLEARKGKPDAYLLTGTCKPSEPHTLYVRYKRFLKRNGFESYTFHALRHTFATRGIESGFDAKSLSEILGHSDVATTMRCYIHPSVEQKRKQMENLFNDSIRGQKYGI